MTTCESIDALRGISVEYMGAAEGVVVSRAVWEYGKLPAGSDEKAKLERAVVEAAEKMKDRVCAVEGTEYPSAMILLYTAYNITADESFKSVITELEKSDTYMGLAFDMNYETMFGGKERYHALTVEFAGLMDKSRESEMDEALFMLALVDTIAAIAEPVYELYRSLVDMFRGELKKLVEGAWQREGRVPCGIPGEHADIFKDEKAQEVMSLALSKACELKVVLAEKYQAYI